VTIRLLPVKNGSRRQSLRIFSRSIGRPIWVKVESKKTIAVGAFRNIPPHKLLAAGEN
jgi:hypothetical protein